MLQPLNMNPVQPRLAGNGLNFLDDTGAIGVGYNEFTRLFAGNQIRFVGDGIVGHHDTRTDNVIVSGLFNRLSFSAGQFHYESTGIRPNNDSRYDIYNAFLQGQISRNTSAQVEIRGTEFNGGDQRLLFDGANFLPGVRTPRDTESIRLGGRHAFAQNSLILALYVHHKFDGLLDTGLGFRVATQEDADFVELRYLHGWRRVNLTMGAGRYEAERIEARTLGPMQFPSTCMPIRHTNAYVYADVIIARPLVASVGVSRDDFKNVAFDLAPLNPKLGLTWTPDQATTIRLATVRSLKRTLILSQTIEPTQVAGFNQFFDDDNGTDAWRSGLAVDRRIGRRVFTGVEVTHRDLESPSRDTRTGAVTFREGTDWMGSAYVYTAATEWMALSTDTSSRACVAIRLATTHHSWRNRRRTELASKVARLPNGAALDGYGRGLSTRKAGSRTRGKWLCPVKIASLRSTRRSAIGFHVALESQRLMFAMRSMRGSGFRIYAGGTDARASAPGLIQSDGDVLAFHSI